MKQKSGLLEKLWFKLLLLFTFLLIVFAVTIGIVFGVSLQSTNKDNEETQPKFVEYVHPMFKPIVKKGVTIFKSNIVAGNPVLRKVRLFSCLPALTYSY